jgi:hypothetical protein
LPFTKKNSLYPGITYIIYIKEKEKEKEKEGVKARDFRHGGGQARGKNCAWLPCRGANKGRVFSI